MNKPYIFLSFLCVAMILALTAAAQKTETFTINIPEQRVNGSRYGNIEFLDIRNDTSYFGSVQVGLVNTRAKVVPKPNIGNQFKNLLAAMITTDASPGKLLFVLRRFAFKEATSATSETGYFYVRAMLLAENGGKYNMVGTLDTVVQFRAMDVTQRLLRTGGKILTGFIQDNLVESPSDESYTISEIRNIDSLQKSSILLYTSEKYIDGIYVDYNEFKNQQPSITGFSAEISKKGKLSKVKLEDNTEIDADEYYVVVYKGLPYLSTKYGYYPIEKRGNDFYYTGKMKSYRGIPAAAVMLGLVGALIASTGTEIVEHRLDHVSGMFVYSGPAQNR